MVALQVTTTCCCYHQSCEWQSSNSSFPL